MSYGYDNVYKLTSEAVTNDPGSHNGTVNYTNYDAVGNRLAMTSTLSGVPGGTFSYDNNDRFTTDIYDANGNTVSSAGTANTYDFENHMLTHGAVAMVYDGDGNRVSETVGGTTTKYLVDSVNPTGYAQVLDELISGAVTRTYAYGLQRISENQKIGTTQTASFYGYDGHGNVRYLTGAAGTTTDTYVYDAFGLPLTTTGTTPNSFLYSGEQFDGTLGLYYQRARYYNPATGRFLTMDPELGATWDPSTLHKYAYTQNNPVNGIDPTGRADTAEYGVNTIGTYNKLTNLSEVGDGIENHHLIPKSFACIFEVTSGEMLAIALLPGPHQAFDNAWDAWWRNFGKVGERCNEELVGTEDLLGAAEKIYADDPEIVSAIKNWFSALQAAAE